MVELEVWNSKGQRPPALSHPITARDENNALEVIFPKKLPFKQRWRKFINRFKKHG